MKRNILAIVIPTLLVTGIANSTEIYNKDGNKLDIYGKVDVRHMFAKSESGQDGDDSRVRLGLKGDTQITNNLIGFGRFEWETKTNKGEGNDKDSNRLAYAGLKFAEFGSIDYGRNYGVLYDVMAWTDVLPYFGNDTMSATDNYMTGRNRNLLTYRNNNAFGYIDGLSFALQYQGKNTDSGDGYNGNLSGSDNNRKNNGDGFGFATAYDIGWGVSLGGAYSKSDRASEQSKDGQGSKAEAWDVGLKFDANDLYLAAIYGQTRNMTYYGDDHNTVANKTENIEIVGQYMFDFGLQPSIAYLQSKGKDLGNYGNKDLVKYISLGSSYYFNKNFSAMVEYKVNLLKDNSFTKNSGINTDNVVGLGLVYQF